MSKVWRLTRYPCRFKQVIQRFVGADQRLSHNRTQ
jgi:hypothetical protein